MELRLGHSAAAAARRYDAVIVFGGAMHADQDDHHPWLGEETMWLQRLLAPRTPVLGVCLGVQLLARAAGAWVGRMPAGPELGWCPVELTDAGVDDPVLGGLPPTVRGIPVAPLHATGSPRAPSSSRATRRARRRSGSGERVWGVQFHPEVTAQLQGWIADDSDPPPDPDALRAEIPEKIGAWNDLGVLALRGVSHRCGAGAGARGLARATRTMPASSKPTQKSMNNASASGRPKGPALQRTGQSTVR